MAVRPSKPVLVSSDEDTHIREAQLAALEPWALALEAACKRQFDEVAKLDDLEQVHHKTTAMLNQVEEAQRRLKLATERTELLATELRVAGDRRLIARADEMTAYRFEDRLVAAQAHLRQSLPTDSFGQRWSLWKTQAQEMEVYGTGIRMYFSSTNTLLIATGIAAALVLPFVFFNVHGERFKTLKGIGGISENGLGQFTQTTLGNLGMTSIQFWCSTWGSDQVAQLCGALDALAVLIIYVTAVWFEYKTIPDMVHDETEKVVSPDNYTAYVDKLPKALKPDIHEAYAKLLQFHFEALLRAQVTPGSARRGMAVIRAEESGPARFAMRRAACGCCSRRSDRDGFQQIGKIVRVQESTVTVHWPGGAAADFNLDGEDPVLLDAELLWRLDAANCAPPLPGQKLPQPTVYKVALVRDYGGQLAALRQKNEDERDRLGAACAKAGDAKVALKFTEKYAQRVNNVIVVPPERRKVLAAFVTFSHTKYRDFIVEEEYRFSRSWGFVRFLTQAPNLRFGGRHPIRVDEAPAPSEIFWENLDYSNGHRMLRRVVIVISCAILMLACVGLLSLAKQATNQAKAQGSNQQNCILNITLANTTDCVCTLVGYQQVMNDNPIGIRTICQGWVQKQIQAGTVATIASLGSCVVNLAAGYLSGVLARFERPVSVTQLNLFILQITFLVKLMTLGIITVLVNANFRVNILGEGILGLIGNGDYTDVSPAWFAIVGGQVLSLLFYSIWNPFFSATQVPVFKARRYVGTSKTKSWPKLKEVYTPPEFPIAQLHAEQLSAVCATLLFSGGMPLLIWFLFARMVITYWCDKFTFLRGSCIPPRYTHHLTLASVRWIQVFCFFHALLGVFTFGNDITVPGEEADFGAFPDFIASLLGKWTPWATIVYRAFMKAAIPNTLLVCGIGAVYGIRFSVFFFGRRLVEAFVSTAEFALGTGNTTGRRTKARRASVFDDAITDRPLKEMVRNKVEHSYEIMDMSKYKFLEVKKLNHAVTKVECGLRIMHAHEQGGNQAKVPRKKLKSDKMRWPAAMHVERDADGYIVKPDKVGASPSVAVMKNVSIVPPAEGKAFQNDPSSQLGALGSSAKFSASSGDTAAPAALAVPVTQQSKKSNVEKKATAENKASIARPPKGLK